MRDNNSFTADELELSADIMSHTIRRTAMELSFLQRAVYSLKTEPADEVETICSDYEYLYYNPKWVISMYTKNKDKLRNAIIHTVLHSLYLHPSMTSEKDDIFDTAADFSVFCMMKSAGLLLSMGSADSEIEKFLDKYNVSSTAELYDLASSDVKAFNKMFSIVTKLKSDDHQMWYTRREKNKQKPPEAPEISGGAVTEGEEAPVQQVSAAAAAELSEAEQNWTSLLTHAKVSARSEGFGSQHGNMFMEMKKPDRFSKFSYLEYIRRFAMQEIMSEDPDTFDLMMYTWGMDNLGDTPIIEFSETREQCSVTDIIIAIDMSGSCGGEIAANFLRQIYSLFEQMNIRSSVNIHVVTFDTCIISKKVIRSRRDADELLKNYRGEGWGGTDFTCVFNYAGDFSKQNHGKRLKGLFFFSDAMGMFPAEKPRYRTTFFIPENSSFGSGPFWEPNVPDWVEMVHYKD
ncbi:MAG: VWA-like domain-containing protein [Oscillospiraceae bacterium]